MKKRIISYIMALLTVLTVIFVPLSLSIDTSALTPTYIMSSSYKNSKYYKNLTGLELTADQRTDIVRVALTQLGYHEGNSNDDFHGGNSSGSKNFVEYNRFHGLIDNNEGNGLSYGYYWCASFATWCASQAGISSSDIKKSVSCRELVNFFRNNGTYFTRASGYIPKTGDIILFKDANSAVSATHTGIVIYSDGSKVYTVEGNASSFNAVSLREYALTNSYIVGYGSPKLKENAEEKIDFSMKNGYLKGDYIVKASSAAVKQSASSSSATLASLALGDQVKLVEISGSYGKINKGSLSGWVSLSGLQILNIQTYTLSYNSDGAYQEVDEELEQKYDRLFTVTSKIPVRSGYSFLGWSDNKNATEAKYSAGDKISLSKDTTLYAVWSKDDYVINFYNYDGTLISSQSYNSGDTVKAPTSPTRASDGVYNYVFIGWDSQITKATENKDYKAQYKAVAISTVPNNNQQGGDVSTNLDVDDGSSSNSVIGGVESADKISVKKKGCASIIGVSGTLMLAMTILGATVLKKKKD